MKCWHAISHNTKFTCAAIACLNKYWHVWARASAMAHYSLTGLLKLISVKHLIQRIPLTHYMYFNLNDLNF